MRGVRFAVAPTGREDVASCQRRSAAFFHNNNTEQSCIFGALLLGLRAPDGAGDPALGRVTAGLFRRLVGHVFRCQWERGGLQIYAAPFRRSRKQNPGWPARPREAVRSNRAALLIRNSQPELGNSSPDSATRTRPGIYTVTAVFRGGFPGLASPLASQP